MTLKNTTHVLLFILFFSTKSVHAQAVEVNGADKDFVYTGTPDSGMIRWANVILKDLMELNGFH